MFLSKPKYLVNIKLENENVFLNGNSNESENTKLHGILEVSSSPKNCPSSPSNIRLSLDCNLKIISKDLFSSGNSQTLFRLNWSFKCYFDFSQALNTLKFPFTAKIPGDLPASADLDDFKISYQFKAYEENPLLQTTLATKQIFINRLTHIPSPQYTLIHSNNPSLISKAKGRILGDQGVYELEYPKLWYNMDDSMPIKLDLKLVSNQRVHSVIYSIRQSLNLGSIQRTSLSSKSNYNYQLSTQAAYIIPSFKTKSDNPTQLINDYKSSICKDGYVNFKLSIEVDPYSSNQKKFANFTTYNYEYKIEHYLLTQITVIDINDNELKRQVIRVPLTFLPRPKCNSLNPPPSYEEAMSR